MISRITPCRTRPFLANTCRTGGLRLASSRKTQLFRASDASRELCGTRTAPGLAKGASGPKSQSTLSSDTLKLALSIAIGLTISSQPAKADILDVFQAGSNLVQKDTVIGLAFGTAILALGAVTIGVRTTC